MLEIGSLVDGKYKILNKVGQGGMSVVYLAMNEKANKQWAVKEVRKDGIKDFEVVKNRRIGLGHQIGEKKIRGKNSVLFKINGFDAWPDTLKPFKKHMEKIAGRHRQFLINRVMIALNKSANASFVLNLKCRHFPGDESANGRDCLGRGARRCLGPIHVVERKDGKNVLEFEKREVFGVISSQIPGRQNTFIENWFGGENQLREHRRLIAVGTFCFNPCEILKQVADDQIDSMPIKFTSWKMTF